jgi:hypothetical protein
MRCGFAPALTLALTFVLLAGCRKEPDFDERYDAASKTIGQTAKEIDAQVSGSPAPVDPKEPGDADKTL